ncbi:hypothetical protein LF887_05345 [Chryseobacterium sp. MEBOG06]|nr:hypothetical protein LF887_05345 [Chryseobacterium sp. MEBOG06]
MLEQRTGVYNNPYKFNAKELDKETGLYYYGARYYNPRASIWYGVDLMGKFRMILFLWGLMVEKFIELKVIRFLRPI